MNKISVPVLLSLLIMGCSTNQKARETSLKEYYFNVSCFKSCDTISYVNQNDTSEKSYWVLQSKLEGNDTLLFTTILNTHKQLSEEMELKLGEFDAKILQYTLYNDSMVSVQCRIIDSTYFKWFQNTGDTISWKVEFPEFSNKGIVEFTRSRTLVRIDTANEEVIFWDTNKMILKDIHKGYKFFIESRYKKGLGLMEYKITNPKGIIKDFKRTN